MTPHELRAAFPVTEAVAYLNAGTCGPLPRAAVDAMGDELAHAAAEGRAMPYFTRMIETHGRLRAAYAGVVGAQPQDIALTTATSDGMVRALLGLDLAPFDEILTAELEHPGLLGPLTALRDRLGVVVREVPLAEIAGAVGERTKLVACSHVAWTTGEVAPDLSGLDVPVLLDGAQGAGAIPVDVAALGCAFYAAAGQKWLCGPVGTGLLYVAPAWRERVAAAGPTYLNLGDPSAGLGARPWPDARAYDSAALSLEAAACALAAHDTLAAFGWDAVHERARTLAAALADGLAAAGREVAPRGATTLVSWVSDDAEAEVARLLDAGVIARGFPGLPWVRASVGAWNDERDIDRLLAVSGAAPPR
jgi:selenocysteine lyase/cysteine desulfurase